jgi:hypothetical protein
MNKNLTIRNSTVEFLIFTTSNGQDTIEVKVEDETVWLTQKLIAKLFDINVATVNEHLKNIFKTNELEENSTIRKFLIVQKEGKREVSRNIDHYNLEVIISLGYRINSNKATEFRRWATQVLKTFTTRGYVLDNERLKNGSYLNPQYYKDLILEIRDIRESERNFYQQITDIYTTALDYDFKAPTTQEFFATVQNKLHWAIHGHTASELLVKEPTIKKSLWG